MVFGAVCPAVKQVTAVYQVYGPSWKLNCWAGSYGRQDGHVFVVDDENNISRIFGVSSVGAALAELSVGRFITLVSGRN